MLDLSADMAHLTVPTSTKFLDVLSRIPNWKPQCWCTLINISSKFLPFHSLQSQLRIYIFKSDHTSNCLSECISAPDGTDLLPRALLVKVKVSESRPARRLNFSHFKHPCSASQIQRIPTEHFPNSSSSLWSSNSQYGDSPSLATVSFSLSSTVAVTVIPSRCARTHHHHKTPAILYVNSQSRSEAQRFFRLRNLNPISEFTSKLVKTEYPSPRQCQYISPRFDILYFDCLLDFESGGYCTANVLARCDSVK